MTDKELLELVAKAAGEIPKSFYGNENYLNGVLDRWNPLDDDGQALRLAVKLEFHVSICLKSTPSYVIVGYRKARNKCETLVEEFSDDPFFATRRAIVRAAAEIGKNM